MTTKLIKARRAVDRMRLEASGAGQSDLAIWDASQKVVDLEAAERDSAVRAARTAGQAMDVVLLVVAVLTMGFSAQNIHNFAMNHGVGDPIAWFVAPAVDLALVAALLGDALLSRWQLDAGPWATRLRWYTGAATVTLNSWQAWADLDAAAILLHTAMPVLLFVLAEAASPYRHQFAETVRLAAQADTQAPETDPAGADTPAPTVVDTAAVSIPEPVADGVYDQEADRAVSTMTPQVEQPGTAAPVRVAGGPDEADTARVDIDPEPSERLGAEDAKRVIEDSWERGLSVREAAVVSTRSPSYVGGVYARLTRARGDQPLRGQTTIEIPDAGVAA